MTETLGDRIKKLRESAGLSRDQLGRVTHISWQTIRTWEQGSALPSLNCTMIIADYFGVSLDWLTGRATTPQKAPQEGARQKE